VEANFYF